MDYRPSQVAASACILAINIYMEDKPSSKDFYKKSPNNNLKLLNTDIWNNEEVLTVTGYTILDIR